MTTVKTTVKKEKKVKEIKEKTTKSKSKKNEENKENVQENIGNVKENIGNVQENVGNVQENVGNVQENVGNVQEKIENIQENNIGNVKENIANVGNIQENMENVKNIQENIQKNIEENVKSKKMKTFKKTKTPEISNLPITSEQLSDKIMSENLVFLRTVQSSAIRTLSESLKEILTDVNIHFDDKGIRIMTTDQYKKAFVHLKLDADKFENYYCRHQITIGLNMISLHKLLKTISNSDIITLYITKNDDSKLGIKIENKEKKIVSISKLKLLDLDNNGLTIPEIIFESIFTLPCVDFQKHCRDLSTIGEHVQIFTRQNGDVFTMYSIGDFAEQEIQIGPTVNEDDETDKKELIGIYTLKYLNLFCKASGLCPSVEIYLRKEFPLLLAYSVANLGTIRIGLAPESNESS